MTRAPAPTPLLPTPLLEILLEGQTESWPSAKEAEGIKARILERVRGDHPTAALLTIRAAEGEWLRLGPKLEMKTLRKDADTTSFLLRLAPGAVLPPHEHERDEECICLEGEVRFGDILVKAGDFHLAPRGTPHGLMRSRTGALLYLRGADPRDYRQRPG